jgi:hypothetical protein
MKGLELLETYPKAADAIKEFYYGKMIESLQEDNDIPQDFKDMVKAQSFDNEYIATFIDNNPRFLFDLLDANDIIVHTPSVWVEDVVEFGYTIARTKGRDVIGSFETYPHRNIAEGIAMEKAIEHLNDKL